MSLKLVHLVFLVSAALLCGGLGLWSLFQTPRGPVEWALAVVGLGGLVTLVLYGRWFLRELRGVDFL